MKIFYALSCLFISACSAQEYAYIINAMTNNIVVATINSDGDLVHTGNKYTTSTDPEDWGVYNANRNLYTLSWAENKLSMFQLGSNGVLEALSPRDIPTGIQPWLLAITPNGMCGYTGNYGDGSISAFKMQPNGQISAVETIATKHGRIAGTATDKEGNLLFALSHSNNKLLSYFIDRDSCKISQTAFIYDTSVQPSRMRVIQLGNKQYLYIINSGTNLINEYEVNSDGSLNPIGALSSGGVDPMNIFIIGGINAYIPNRGSNTISWFKVSSDGSLNFMRTYNTNGSGSRNIVFGNNNRSMYVANQNSNDFTRFDINTDGTLSYIGKYSSGGMQPFGMVIVNQ